MLLYTIAIISAFVIVAFIISALTDEEESAFDKDQEWD